MFLYAEYPDRGLPCSGKFTRTSHRECDGEPPSKKRLEHVDGFVEGDKPRRDNLGVAEHQVRDLLVTDHTAVDNVMPSGIHSMQ